MHNDFHINQYYSQFHSKNVLAIFQGALSQSILSEMAESLKEKLHCSEVTKGKIFAIFIELAQNIYHHSAQKTAFNYSKQHIGVGIISIQELPDCFLLSAGNLIERQKKDSLEKRCALINTLDRDHLSEFYRKERKMAKDNIYKGGHVGLIDMARRSRNPLTYSFDDFSDEHVFYSITVQVDKE